MKNLLLSHPLAHMNKTLVGALAVVLTGLNALYAQNPYVQLAIALATALGVYSVPNA